MSLIGLILLIQKRAAAVSFTSRTEVTINDPESDIRQSIYNQDLTNQLRSNNNRRTNN
jgi:hypothetical protein